VEQNYNKLYNFTLLVPDKNNQLEKIEKFGRYKNVEIKARIQRDVTKFKEKTNKTKTFSKGLGSFYLYPLAYF
jgi:hypothetical protein